MVKFWTNFVVPVKSKNNNFTHCSLVSIKSSPSSSSSTSPASAPNKNSTSLNVTNFRNLLLAPLPRVQLALVHRHCSLAPEAFQCVCSWRERNYYWLASAQKKQLEGELILMFRYKLWRTRKVQELEFSNIVVSLCSPT